MPVFSLGFSEKLIDAAQFILDDEGEEFDKVQTVLYLCHLSCEITLKAILERAGIPMRDIIACSHNFEKMFEPFFTKIEIHKEVGNSIFRWVKAGGIGCERTMKGPYEPAIRTMLTNKNTSQYPSKLRYVEDHISAYPPGELIKAARILLQDAHKYWEHIRLTT
jgi:hypothetical protein